MTSASLLPNGKQQFLDQNGDPLASGQVFFYIPNTTTFKTTWQDPDGTIENLNPVLLDTAGEAVIYGAGQYRQVVKDVFGNTIWDELTQSNSLIGVNYPVEVADLPDLPPLATDVANVAYVYSKRGLDDFVLQDWADWSTLAASDPLGGVIQKSTVDTTKCWVRSGFWGGGLVRAEWFGWQGTNDPTVDDAPSLQAGINFAGAVYNDGQGTFVTMPVGTTFLGSGINLPNRVGVKGPNGRGLVIKPKPGFTADTLFYASNGTSSMFGSRLEDMFIDASGFDFAQVIQSDAWQETCGMYRVCMEWDGNTASGVHLSHGYGGASFTTFEDCEFFSNSSNAGSVGIKVDEISLIGGFLLIVNRTTITGSSANILENAILMANDSVQVSGLHCEDVANMVQSIGVGNISVDGLTGSGAGTTDMVVLGSTFTGKVSLRNIIPNGATGHILLDATGKIGSIPVGNNLAAFDGPYGDCTVQCDATKANVTGDGTQYTVDFDTVVYDPLGGYSIANKEFVMPEGLPQWVEVDVTLAILTGGTNTGCVVQLWANGVSYEIIRFSPTGVEDGSAKATVSGTTGRIPVPPGATIFLVVIGSGGAAGSMSILPGTKMSIQNLSR